MLHGTSPVVFRQASTALIRVISSPLSSVAPLPKILFPFLFCNHATYFAILLCSFSHFYFFIAQQTFPYHHIHHSCSLFYSNNSKRTSTQSSLPYCFVIFNVVIVVIAVMLLLMVFYVHISLPPSLSLSSCFIINRFMTHCFFIGSYNKKCPPRSSCFNYITRFCINKGF